MKGKTALFGGLMLVAASASAQGVFSFDDIPLKGEPTVEVNLDEAMLKLLGGAAQEHQSIAAPAGRGSSRDRCRRATLVQPDPQDELAKRAPSLFAQTGRPQLVLVTCENYDPATGHYASNVVVTLDPVR